MGVQLEYGRNTYSCQIVDTNYVQLTKCRPKKEKKTMWISKKTFSIPLETFK